MSFLAEGRKEREEDAVNSEGGDRFGKGNRRKKSGKVFRDRERNMYR